MASSHQILQLGHSPSDSLTYLDDSSVQRFMPLGEINVSLGAIASNLVRGGPNITIYTLVDLYKIPGPNPLPTCRVFVVEGEFQDKLKVYHPGITPDRLVTPGDIHLQWSPFVSASTDGYSLAFANQEFAHNQSLLNWDSGLRSAVQSGGISPSGRICAVVDIIPLTVGARHDDPGLAVAWMSQVQRHNPRRFGITHCIYCGSSFLHSLTESSQVQQPPSTHRGQKPPAAASESEPREGAQGQNIAASTTQPSQTTTHPDAGGSLENVQPQFQPVDGGTHGDQTTAASPTARQPPPESVQTVQGHNQLENGSTQEQQERQEQPTAARQPPPESVQTVQHNQPANGSTQGQQERQEQQPPESVQTVQGQPEQLQGGNTAAATTTQPDQPQGGNTAAVTTQQEQVENATVATTQSDQPQGGNNTAVMTQQEQVEDATVATTQPDRPQGGNNTAATTTQPKEQVEDATVATTTQPDQPQGNSSESTSTPQVQPTNNWPPRVFLWGRLLERIDEESGDHDQDDSSESTSTRQVQPTNPPGVPPAAVPNRQIGGHFSGGTPPGGFEGMGEGSGDHDEEQEHGTVSERRNYNLRSAATRQVQPTNDFPLGVPPAFVLHRQVNGHVSGGSRRGRSLDELNQSIPPSNLPVADVNSLRIDVSGRGNSSGGMGDSDRSGNEESIPPQTKKRKVESRRERAKRVRVERRASERSSRDAGARLVDSKQVKKTGVLMPCSSQYCVPDALATLVSSILVDHGCKVPKDLGKTFRARLSPSGNPVVMEDMVAFLSSIGFQATIAPHEDRLSKIAVLTRPSGHYLIICKIHEANGQFSNHAVAYVADKRWLIDNLSRYKVLQLEDADIEMLTAVDENKKARTNHAAHRKNANELFKKRFDGAVNEILAWYEISAVSVSSLPTLVNSSGDVHGS